MSARRESGLPRRLATVLLESAIAIAPGETLAWGQAMLSELGHVEGNWSALFWSLGGAGVLAKQALVALILPSAKGPVPSGGDLFSKEGSMRKAALGITAACAMATLLLFLAPVFRQAFRVSLGQWHDVLHVPLGPGYPYRDEELDALTTRVERNRDAEGVAFVAVAHANFPERARLAEEAVRLDPNLVWIYAVVATPFPPKPDFQSWIDALENFDPQNALPYLMQAQQIDIDQVVRKALPKTTEDEPAAWKDAMAAAFRSPKLDTYTDRLKELDRRVLQRYRIEDPVRALNDSGYRWPSNAVLDSSRYMGLVLGAGRALEEKGDLVGAAEKYLIAARYSQKVGPLYLAFLGPDFEEPYKRLQALAQRQGKKDEAEFYASLADRTAKGRGAQIAALRAKFLGADVSRWNGLLVRIAGVVLLVSGALFAGCVIALVVRQPSFKVISLVPSSFVLTIGCCAAIASLLSAGLLYAAYRPYADMVQRFIRNGDDTRFGDLGQFLWATEMPLGAGGFVQVREWVFNFWLIAVVLCAVTLFFAVWRYSQARRRVAATA